MFFSILLLKTCKLVEMILAFSTLSHFTRTNSTIRLNYRNRHYCRNRNENKNSERPSLAVCYSTQTLHVTSLLFWWLLINPVNFVLFPLMPLRFMLPKDFSKTEMCFIMLFKLTIYLMTEQPTCTYI